MRKIYEVPVVNVERTMLSQFLCASAPDIETLDSEFDDPLYIL